MAVVPPPHLPVRPPVVPFEIPVDVTRFEGLDDTESEYVKQHGKTVDFKKVLKDRCPNGIRSRAPQ